MKQAVDTQLTELGLAKITGLFGGYIEGQRTKSTKDVSQGVTVVMDREINAG